MKKFLLSSLLSIFSSIAFSQGCTVQESASSDTIICGQQVMLSAFGQGQGTQVLSEDFNTGSFGSGWSATTQAMWNNPCGPNTIDGSTYLWMGNSSPVPRVITTTAFNLSSCANAGVTICFDMRYAVQGDNAPCEGPDLPAEGVYLQYSTDNGATWNTIQYWDPNGGYDPQLNSWNQYCVQVPLAALINGVKFRWYQDNDSGADYDHWGIDNVAIYCNDPTYNIVWTHDGYSAGPTGGTDPTAVSPHTTTNYVVVMSNGTITCMDTVTVVVRNPTLVVDAGSDTSVCTGTCAQLHATAKVIVNAAKTPTFTDAETATITGSPGIPGIPPFIPPTPGTADLAMSIGVSGLGMPSIQNGSITSVCIGSLNMTAFGGIEIFEIWLVCPSGDSILLVPDSTISGTSLSNTCFVPAGAAITSGTSPYTGNYSPNEPFGNLAGCSPNGQWTLHLHAVYYAFTLPIGTFNSWSITFNDPEISYTGNFTWSPTVNMTGSNTLTPTVCPPPNAYTLTMSDTAGCTSASDVVNVTTHTCCNFSVQPMLTQPSCGASNGSISLAINPAGNYTFAWSDGPSTSQNRTNLAAGSYHVTITDATNNCTKDTILTLNSSSNLSLTFPSQTNPTCAGNDGSVTATLSGGTAPYTITIDTNGVALQTVTSPIAGTQTVPNLPAGTITVSITDAGGCQTSNSVTLTAPTNCCTFSLGITSTQPTCGNSNGSATVSVQNGSGNYTYAWSPGGSTSATASNLAAGTVSVTVTDNGQSCSKDTSITLNSNSTLSLVFSNRVNPTCAGHDGSLTATLSGGTAPYNITIDTNGVVLQTVTSPVAGSQNVPNLSAGIITVSITDGAGCQISASDTLVAPANCCTFIVSANITSPSCGQSDGGVSLTASNGSGNYAYNWGSGLGSNSSVSNVGAGNYNVTITDNSYANCTIDTTFSLTNPNAPVINGVNIINETCPGSGDGNASVNASGGTGNLTYTWADGQTGDTAVNLTAGTIGFTVTDANGCQTAGTANIQSGFCCTLQTSAGVVPPACGQNTGTINVTVTTAGTLPYQYSIDGTTFQASGTFNNVPAGNYNVITIDATLCHDTVAVTIPQGGANLSVSIASTNSTCFGSNDGTATASSANGNSPFTYSWTTGGSTDVIDNLAPGNYNVTVTDPAGCSGTASTTITEPAALSIDLGADITICEGEVITIDAGAGYSSYVWSTNEITQVIHPVASGIYSVTVTDANGCTANDRLNVDIIPTPTVNLGDDKLVYEGDHVGLFASITGNTNGATYNWQPDTLISCAICQNTVALAVDTISYTLVYTDQNGCSASDTINLFVLPVKPIFWPNAFSPNGDGNNDIFIPYGSDVKLIDWKVFNRWGELVFESTNFFQGWDGTYKGKLQPPNVYIYEAQITMMNGVTKSYKGSFTLIR